jgi:hypothetical protein
MGPILHYLTRQSRDGSVSDRPTKLIPSFLGLSLIFPFERNFRVRQPAHAAGRYAATGHSQTGSTHHAFAVFVPIIVQRNVWIDGGDVVLPCDRKQHAGGAYERPELILNRRFDAEEIETVWSGCRGMAIQSAWDSMHCDEFEIKPEAAHFIHNVFGDESRIDDIALIGRCVAGMAGYGLGVEDPAAESKGLEVFPKQHALG